MTHSFDPGSTSATFQPLFEDYPGDPPYKRKKFRTEWGPVFYRGRLDGSARALVIGQDPAQHEGILRRILVGEAGGRVQGFLAKLGMGRSYIMINTFLYSVYGTADVNDVSDPDIAGYRNKWLNALLRENRIQVVIALGTLATKSWDVYKASPGAVSSNACFVHITHPTQPESSSKGNKAKLTAATKQMLENWNQGLQQVQSNAGLPNSAGSLVLYGSSFRNDEIVEIPEQDVPPGIPAWMRQRGEWVSRVGATAVLKRATLRIVVPRNYLS